jgi:hypothetical protein
MESSISFIRALSDSFDGFSSFDSFSEQDTIEKTRNNAKKMYFLFILNFN